MTRSQTQTPLSRAQATALVDAVMERGDLAITASAYEDEDTGEWIFEANCDSPPDLDSFYELARLTLGGSVSFDIETVDPDIDWVGRSLKGLQPVTAGGFHIHGSHDTAEPPAGAIPMLIDAAEAFGTGHHETTAGCLEAIATTLKRKKPKFCLDVGTGTGVLAIAMAKRLRLAVIATDIDPVAIGTAARNALRNGVTKHVLTTVAPGLEHPLVTGNAPYDLIVANILAKPLVRLAPSIGRAAAQGATIILSGLLLSQASAITAAYRQHGMVLTSRITRNEWATLTLEKRTRF